MDVANHGVGKLMVHLGMLVDAPLRFQTAGHPLDVLLGYEGDLFVAQLRLDVVLDIAAIAFERTGPHRARFVLCEPAIQPLAQRHAAVLGQFHVTVALDVLVQLVQQCLLRLGVDMAEQRLAVFLVANDDAALPASIVTLSHHAVTGRSSFCHVFHFLWIHFLLQHKQLPHFCGNSYWFLKDLDRLLEVESFLEGDPSVGALHLTDTPTTQKLIVTCVHIGVLRQNVIA